MLKSINELRSDYYELIKMIHDSIIKFSSDAEVYLFGSYAKGCPHKCSDIDLLILFDRDINLRECRRIKFDLEDFIYEDTGVILDLDLKVYTKQRFTELTNSLGFEKHISEYMLPLK